MDNILEVRGLKMHFGGVKAVDELSFDVHRHELLGVIGPNGSGKTTMFNALTGVYKPTDGKVTFNGIDITGKPLDSMVNYGIARTFQNLRVFKAMTVLDNIMIGNSKNIHTNLFDAALHTPRYRKYEKESLEKARELLSLLGLSRWENEYVGSIPYGIQKRIEFARAVIVEPQLLLLDEPAAGLNSKEAEDLMQMILWVKDKKGFTVILIDHNMKIICFLYCAEYWSESTFVTRCNCRRLEIWNLYIANIRFGKYIYTTLWCEQHILPYSFLLRGCISSGSAHKRSVFVY